MDQIKIGKFIAKCRKEAGLTQAQLAEKLLITDRAVSKWERAKSMPDSSIMLELCEILGISVNELLTGEKIDMTNYSKQAELNLLKLQKEKERSDRLLLTAEVVIGTISTLIFMASIIASAYIDLNPLIKIAIMAVAIILFLVAVTFCVLIETKAGYYKCGKCGYEYEPSFKAVFLAMHKGRTRYLKCPHCN
ncbi:MAG: helix-turn-helix domain-containing protein, partial [Ruminococcus sp.]